MKDSELLLEVADIVEDHINRGFTVNWYDGSFTHYKDKSACPGFMYGVAKGILIEKDNPIYCDNPLTMRVSSLTRDIRENNYPLNMTYPDKIRQLANNLKKNEQ